MDAFIHSFKHWANVSCFLCSGIVLCASMLEKLTKCLKFLVALYIWERGDAEVKKLQKKMLQVILVHYGFSRTRTQKFYSLYNPK